jgi:hypothetical protein
MREIEKKNIIIILIKNKISTLYIYIYIYMAYMNVCIYLNITI